MSKVEDEKHVAVRELKSKIDANNATLKQIEHQRRQNEIKLRRAAFTAAHLDELPQTAVMYRSVGKAYFFEPKDKIMLSLKEQVEGASGELKQLSATRENLSKKQDSLVIELKELL